MNNTAQLKNYWDKAYESVTTPFDIDAPDEWIMALEVSGKIHGDVLDSGCGPGRTSLYLADLGYFAIGTVSYTHRAATGGWPAAHAGRSARAVRQAPVQ